MANLLFDLNYALRQLRKSPVFTLTAVLTLALGIGATVVMFSFVDAVLLKPLRYRDSGQLVAVWERVGYMAELYPQVGPNPRHADFWRRTSTAFQGFSLAHVDAAGVSLDGKRPSFVGRVAAEPNLLHVLGVAPAIGRDFRSDEGADGRENRAVITWDLWHRLYGGDPGVLGRTIYLGTRPLQIIGVLPSGFYFPRANELNAASNAQSVPAIEVITPTQLKPEHSGWDSDSGNFVMIGRLKPNVTPADTQAQLDVLDREIVRLATEGNFTGDPAAALSSVVVPLKEAIVGKSSRALTFLFAAVLAVLLIACINLANAQLARAMARDREVAMCAALGASVSRLLRTSLAESTLIAIGGGTLGALLAELAVHYGAALVRVSVPRAEDVHISPIALAFALLCTVGATVLVGLLPAMRALRNAPKLCWPAPVVLPVLEAAGPFGNG